MGDDLGIGGRLEERTPADEIVMNGMGVGQVPVVGDGPRSVQVLEDERLGELSPQAR